MRQIQLVLVALFIMLSFQTAFAQEQLRFSGNLETNGNWYQRDTLIGAANIPQYDNQLYGSDSWLTLNAAYQGFQIGARFDVFNNSQLLNPQGIYTDMGIGRWFFKKQVKQFGIEGGYIYDQIGSGLIFRAYEERPLAIDNALKGIKGTYDIGENWQLKAFTGRQKQQFDDYNSIIAGGSIEGFIASDSTNITLAPGIGTTRRILDQASMNSLLSTISTYAAEDKFVPKYNTYALTLYNTLSAGNFAWYAEAAYKSDDNMADPFNDNVVYQAEGTVLYSSLSWAKKGFGITLEGKYTENFSFRTRPQEQLFRGLINYLPPMTRVNTYRLTSRYTAATQDLGEVGGQADIRYKISKKAAVNVNLSYIDDLDGKLLYREMYSELTLKNKRKWSLVTGLQLQEYNQEVYLLKVGGENIKTIIPYFDFTYRFAKKKAIRFEGQYMATEQDFGSWAFGLVELTMAPHWTFTISDMYNIDPNEKNELIAERDGEKLKIHYPRFDVYYTHKTNRFSLSYVKQVEGIVCAGGICRLEPAFSGVKFTVNSSF